MNAAQFFLAGLYQAGRGVPRDPVRACALYARAASNHLSPFGREADPLYAAAANQGREFDQECQRFAFTGFHHGFERTTFDLGPGHSVEWTLGSATVTYEHASHREELTFAQSGAHFLPLQHTELSTGPLRSVPRHFIEIFVWRPSSATGPWSLQWHVLEVFRNQIVRIHDEGSLVTVDGDTPPSRDAFDVRDYAAVRLDGEGHPEWAILKGPDARKQRIESEAERREVRDLAATRKMAMEGTDWGERYDVHRQPAMTYVDADGCGSFQLYGWTADRAEAIVVSIRAPDINRTAGPATFDLTRQAGAIRLTAHVYAEPQRRFDFCSDFRATVVGSIEPERWRAVAGDMTIELSAPGVRAHAPHLRRVSVTLRNLAVENAAGVRARIPHLVTLSAIPGG